MDRGSVLFIAVVAVVLAALLLIFGEPFEPSPI